MCKITFRFKSKMGEVPCHIFLILFWINLQFSLVHAYEENCDSYQTKSNTSTLCKQHDHRLVCFHGLEDKWRSGGENVRTLVLCYWPLPIFDPRDVLQGFPSLRKLEIKRGNLTTLIKPFPNESRSIERIEITGTGLKEVPENAFANLSNLRILDFRNNSFPELNVATFNIPSLHHIYLSGNPLKCMEETKWILNREKGSLGHKIADKEYLRCTAPYDGRPLIPVVEIINIKDLRPLTTNPVYKGVIDLYLDGNKIESIVQLEGSSWMDHFRLFSLRGNKLTDLPTYALENVLQHNGNAVSLYLGKNPWTCDCLFTPGFQDLLIRYTNLIKDINDVRCSPNNGDDNSDRIIRDLKRTEICVSSDEDSIIHPLDVLNIILAFLIFLIIGKLLYDYWSFKKTGQLPWIVTKIP
ncbi:protein singed wings 2 isoform X2 [Apis mellifera]|uniref:Protein singed wings 2 isoform X2 n=1 Tax=Apis mellifera TaxID=7460 RepID=A0A7M7IIP1_APIME|nr:protein singed wings 2 isoform X2 [Apis mellifera]|eukprot:XP_016770261.2 protein singed wings 2 isoform X2 [Apis mellifera]